MFKDTEKRREYAKKYYQEHREERKEQDKKYHQRHREAINGRSMEYYKQHKEQLKEYSQKRHKKLREQILTWNQKKYKLIKEWYNKNLDALCCSDCGIKFKNFLPGFADFHHEIKGNRIRLTGCTYNSLAKELENGVFLCPNCHRISHLGQRGG